MRSRVITGTERLVNTCALVAATRAPRDLAAGALLGVVGDAHAFAACLLAEPLDARSAGRGPGRVVGAFRIGGSGDATDDEDLLAVGGDFGRPGEPVVGQAPGEPGGERFGRDRAS